MKPERPNEELIARLDKMNRLLEEIAKRPPISAEGMNSEVHLHYGSDNVEEITEAVMKRVVEALTKPSES